MKKKKTVEKVKSKRPGVAGKGNKVAKAVAEEVVVAEQPRLVEALKVMAKKVEPEPKPVPAPELVLTPEVETPAAPTPAPKAKKPRKPKEVAALQSQAFDPNAVKAAFASTMPDTLPKLSGPFLDVAVGVVTRLGELQTDVQAPVKEEKAPSWLTLLDAGIRDDFEDLALKQKAYAVIATLAEKAAKPIKEELVKAMEMAGVVGEHNPGLGIGAYRAKHQIGESVKVDIDGVFLYLAERGVNLQLLEDARTNNTKRIPFAYVGLYSMIDQRAVNLAAHERGEE